MLLSCFHGVSLNPQFSFFFDRVIAGTYSPRNRCLQEHVENSCPKGRFPSMEGECF